MSNMFFAYIDPMSGAVGLQLIIVFFASITAFFRRTIFDNLRRVFVRAPRNDQRPQ